MYVRISGLVVEYIVAIDVTRVRFPADAFSCVTRATLRRCPVKGIYYIIFKMDSTVIASRSY